MIKSSERQEQYQHQTEESKAELEYLTRIILDDKKVDQEQPTNLNTFNSKHSVFDKINPLEHLFLIPPLSPTQTIYPPNTSVTDPSLATLDASNNCSQDTEIYEVPEVSSKRIQKIKPLPERLEYNLRSLSNYSLPSTSHLPE